MYVYTEIRCNICLPSCMVNKYYYIQRRGVTLKSNRSRSWKMGPIDKSYSRACVTITSYGMCFVSKQLASTSFRRQVLSTLLVYIQRWRGSSGNVRLSDLLVSSCLNWQRLSNGHSEAGSLFQSRGPATSNDLSPRRVLDHGMTHVMAPDERRRRLASGSDLHASERYDGAHPCSVDLNISVASLKSTRHRTGSHAIPAEQVRCVHDDQSAFCADCSR